MKFEGSLQSAKHLTQQNFATLHPWGKIHPGFAADEWSLKWTGKSFHPIGLKPYFESRGFDLSKITFLY
jgi:hypothetical protein